MDQHKLGPTGGIVGAEFDARMPDDEVRISQMTGSAGNRIDAIGLVWINANNKTKPLDPVGGGGGEYFSFPIGDDTNPDYLTKIEGTYGEFDDTIRIKSLIFTTHLGEVSDEYGDKPDIHKFVYECPPDYQITGIWGRAGGDANWVEALGVYIARIPK